MKRYVIDQSFINDNEELVKELGLKFGDTIGFDSAEERSEEEDGHTNPDDPRKPKKP